MARLDVVGMVTLGMITALGGGIVRDIFIDSLPPATFSDWRYLAVAATGSLVAFTFGNRLAQWPNPIQVLDAAGLSLFAVPGALKTLAEDAGRVAQDIPVNHSATFAPVVQPTLDTGTEATRRRGTRLASPVATGW